MSYLLLYYLCNYILNFIYQDDWTLSMQIRMFAIMF